MITSATLSNQEEMEELLGMRFHDYKQFHLENPDRMYLAVISYLNKQFKNSRGKMSYDLDFRGDKKTKITHEI